MKTHRIFLTLTLSGFVLLAGDLFGQDQPQMSWAEHERIDSVQATRDKEHVIQAQKADDQNRMDDAKRAQRETRADAKETQRIDREARKAAREARLALRAERKAQKARKDADKQSDDAERAKTKSDKN